MLAEEKQFQLFLRRHQKHLNANQLESQPDDPNELESKESQISRNLNLSGPGCTASGGDQEIDRSRSKPRSHSPVPVRDRARFNIVAVGHIFLISPLIERECRH